MGGREGSLEMGVASFAIMKYYPPLHVMYISFPSLWLGPHKEFICDVGEVGGSVL